MQRHGDFVARGVPIAVLKFADGGHLEREIWNKLEVKNCAEDAENFRQHGCDGDSRCSGERLLLLANNRAVEAGAIIVRGPIL